MLNLAIGLIALVVPLLLAALLAQIVRMPQYLWRIALVMYVTILPAIGLYPPEQAMRLGIDLSGGTILVYQITNAKSDFDINKMVTALNKRINPTGIVDVTIRGMGRDRVEIIIPQAAPQEVERCKRILTTEGSLEFRFLANQRDHAALITQAKAVFPRPVVVNGKTQARWVPIAKDQDVSNHGGVAMQANPADGGRPYILVFQDSYNVTGDYLVRTGVAEERGQPAVSFRFNSTGATKFANLTRDFAPAEDGFERRLAILLNGEVYSAPNLKEPITGGDGQITGHFTRQAVQDLVSVLNAGSLPGELVKTPASELTIGPTLGRDTIHSGLMAMGIATVVILVFMAIYYHLAGLIADIAVILNCLIVVGLMAWMHATWTLPGLAGLALTVGMAVDANVLIYERFREEQQRGRSLRMTIEYAFNRAFSPILDSNLTTLLAGVILYLVGTEQIKGFAVPLIIGLLANLFTAVFVCRLLFDIIEHNGWVKQITMLSIFGKPNFDFVGKRFICVGTSVVFIVLGLSLLFFRGASILDIDFTGGTLAAVRFQEQTDSGAVRALAEKVLPDVSIETLRLQGEQEGRRFIIRTTLDKPAEVKAKIAEGFGGQLARATMTPSPITEIPKEATAEKPQGDQAGAAPPAEMAHPAFAGGLQTTLTFKPAVTRSLVQNALDAAMSDEKVSDPATHISLVPVEESATSTAAKAEPAAADAKAADVKATNAEAPAAKEAEKEYTSFVLETNLDRATLEKVFAGASQRIADLSMFERLENFGGQVASEMQTKAVIAVLLSMLAMVIYLWVRFQNLSYGLGAVVALMHDVAVVLGLLAVSKYIAGTFLGPILMIDDFKINLAVIAAVLTLVGYSVNDTIVVFDRIREVKGKRKEVTWPLINDSVNQTLSRTILTSLTVWLVAVILYVLGGSAIHGFAFCLVAGVIVGTYSSIYIASPFLVWIGARDPRQSGRGSNQSQGNGGDSGGGSRSRKRNRA